MTKPIMCVFLGDTHVGSNSGLCKPGFILGGAEKRKQRKCYGTLDQERLYKSFASIRNQIKTAAKGYRLFVMLGGDLVDGVNHHGTSETYGNRADQIAMAIDILSPWVAMADMTYGVTGTDAHVGHEGEDDRIVYSDLCPEHYAAKFNLVLDGKRLWWAHHGVKVGGKVWTESNAMYALANDVYFRCLKNGIPKPNLIVAHDQHRSPDSITSHDISVAITPCFQMSTYFGDTIAPFTDTDLGVLTWIPSRQERPEYVKAKISG